MSRAGWSSAFAAIAVVAAAMPAVAATSLQTNASTRQAEVGEGIRVELSALTDGDGSPQNPRLRVPPGFSVDGPSISTSQQISFTNGSFVHRRGITATWVISGTRTGHFTIGPATVDVGQSVMQGETIDVDIVPPGTAPQRPSQRSRGGLFNPFDPFSGFPHLPGFGDDDDLDQNPPQLAVPDQPPPEYALPHAPDPTAFIRVTVEPKNAVIGQEMRLRVYGYGSRGAWDEASASEPSRADFLSQTIVDGSARQPRVFLDIDGTRWIAAKARDVALFPLKSGALVVGPMTFGFRGRGYPESRPGSGLERRSEPVIVQVSEPPLAGRPPGYQLGDVGAYTLSAEVDPRRVEAGGAVAVTVRLEGTGNVPRHVKLPDVPGVEWPEPTLNEAITPTDHGVAGWRQFRYIVRLDQAGARDLGEVTLPFWNPATGAYQIARAALGAVEVTPSQARVVPPPPAPSSAAQREAHDTFEDFTPRFTLSKARAAAPPLTDRPYLWALLVLSPVAVVLLRGLIAALAHARKRLQERAGSKSNLSRKALEEAREAAGKRESGAVASAVERAVYFGIEDRLGLKARAVLRANLAREIERAGAAKDVAEETVSLLDECERLRFGGTGTADLSEVADRATFVLAKLSRSRAGARRDIAA